MAAFNYRDLVRLVSPGSWQFYFQARGIALPEGADWSDPPPTLHKPILQALAACRSYPLQCDNTVSHNEPL